MPNWTDTAPTVDLACPFCAQDGVRRRIVDTVWEAPQSAVYQCSACELVFIHPIMSQEEEQAFYQAEFAKYMEQRGAPGETMPEEHFQKNSAESQRRLANLQMYLRPDMEVLELGSSTGFLLAALAPQVRSVTGIEPGRLYSDYANRHGIITHHDISSVKEQRFDLICAYYVVEHLRDPVTSLREWCALLKPGGYLAIEVPNVNDALVRFYQVPSFDRFYWQKAHYFNYSHRTLARLLQRVGFESTMIAEQRYDLSNHLHWLIKGEPGGKGKYVDVFDATVDRAYARCLKAQWLCDTVFAVATLGGEQPLRKLVPKPAPAIAELVRVREPSQNSQSLVRLNRNERLAPLPDWFVNDLRAAMNSQTLTSYPVADSLYEQLGKHLGLPTEQLLLTPGSDAAIKALYQAYVRPGDTVVMLDPSYAMYEVYAQMFQAKCCRIAFAQNLTLDTQRLLDSVTKDVRLVMIANPNQPTGTLLNQDVLEKLAERTGSIGALLAVDEAYYPFSQTTILPWIARYPHLVVTRTFSKAAGLAGLRLGYVVGHADVIANLYKVRSVHDINSVAILAAQQLLAHPEIITDYATQVAACGKLLTERARALGLEPLPTHTNFLLIRVAHRCPPSELIVQLRNHGYLVKGPFDAPCLADCIRVTLGPTALMAAFADALALSLQNHEPR